MGSETPAEAVDDCIDMLAQFANFDVTEEIAQAIIAEYGDYDGVTTVADALELTEEEQEEIAESGAGCYFHVGIRWNEKEARTRKPL